MVSIFNETIIKFHIEYPHIPTIIRQYPSEILNWGVYVKILRETYFKYNKASRKEQ